MIEDSGATPMGPYFLTDLLGLDTVLHVAEHLHESYGGERFHVSAKMQELVAAGDLGQKTGRVSMSTADTGTSPALSSIVDRMGLKTLVESCPRSPRRASPPRRTSRSG